MLILGIESSCDETAAAVVENGERILSSIVASQVLTHEKYGGGVPAAGGGGIFSVASTGGISVMTGFRPRPAVCRTARRGWKARRARRRRRAAAAGSRGPARQRR